MESMLADVAERIVKVVERRLAEPQRANRPLGFSLLAAPSSEEANQIARMVAEAFYGGPDALLRFDMAEYKERYQIGRLIGPPPGIVGDGPPGLLTEPVRHRPDQVILLERIEEAHPDAQNLLLHIAEEGMIWDNYGRHVDFRGTVVLLTTGDGVDPPHVIRPELIGLLDDVIDCGAGGGARSAVE